MKSLVRFLILPFFLGTGLASTQTKPVRPVLECVQNNGNGTYTAFFGYKNENGVPVTIPIGSSNKFTPSPIDRGQPTVFQPGRRYRVFSVLFNGANLVWTLKGRTSTASSNPTQACVSTDTTRPSLTVTSPEENLLVSAATVQVTGTATDAGSAVIVTANGQQLTGGPGGAFSGTVALTEGQNIITTVARDASNNTATVIRHVTRDSTPPTLTVTSPTDGFVTGQATVRVSGNVMDLSTVTVGVNGAQQTLGQGGLFDTEVSPLEGLYTITIVATDAAGNTSTATRTIRLDSIPPTLIVSSPADGATTNLSSMTVTGTAIDSTTLTVTVNGILQTLGPGGSFSTSVTLTEGSNMITVVATDAAENASAVFRTVTRQETSPGPVTPVLASPSNEAHNQSLLTMLVWHPSDAITIDYQLQLALDSGFSTIHFNDSTVVDTSLLMIQLDRSTRYYWRVSARNSAGRSPWSTIWHFTTRPDTVPVLVAGPIDRTVSTILSEVNRFIYSGERKIQFGVDTSQIDDARFSTIRGTVVKRSGSPLPAVKVTVIDHTEFGHTFTRSDGKFDMVVNGGGLLTVEMTYDGFLPLHRQIHAPWQDYAIIDTAVMIQLDAQVTTVDFTSPIQVASGSEITDDNGSRQATLLFKQGTNATMVYPDSTTRPLSSLRIRATEYTVGRTGLAAMPVQLPPTSGYTYCVELSADEAIVARATRVQFDRPVALYIENFLDFPVGASVPVGWYDRTRGVWIPSDNGRVIKIIDTVDGAASVDIDGDNIADGDSSLDSLGMNEAELQRLALLYSSGETLWRSEVSHFTPFDCNFAYGPPLNAKYPPEDPVTVKGQEVDNSTCRGGSIIGIERQTLGEAIGITGTPYTLHYQSDRVWGYREILEIPITGDDVTADRIVVHVSVSGRLFARSFFPAPNLKLKFAWDGKDAYGRVVQGRQPVVIRVGNVYSQVYYTRSERQRLFGEYPNIENSFSRFRGEIILWTTRTASIGIWELRPLGLGGWSLDVHHVFEPTGSLINLGNGTRRSSAMLGRSISTVAGNGEQTFPTRPSVNSDDRQGRQEEKTRGTAFSPQSRGVPVPRLMSTLLDTIQAPRGVAVGPDGSVYVVESFRRVVERIHPDGMVTRFAGTGTPGYSGDGGPAIEAEFGAPTAVAVGPDGNIYVADQGCYVVRRIAPNGIITTVAGDGTWDFGGDGGLATQAKLGPPTSVAVGPDGSLFIADPYNYRIRRVSTDGIIHTAAGNGGTGFAGDSGFAANASFTLPQGVAVDKEGNLYITDAGCRVRRVARDGIVNTIAGTGEQGYEGDGGQATQATFGNAVGLAVDGAGIVYVADALNNVVRRISPDGIITTIAGTGEEGYNGDGGAAIGSQLKVPIDIAVAPNGSLYIVDSWNNRLRRVAPPFPGFGNLLSPVVSEDGAEIYVFDQIGKHIRTENTLTRVRLTSFSYDSAGRLAAIADIDSLVTTIERDSGGSPVAIVSPFGQRTTLSVSDSGYLASISNPARETVQFTYSSDGLMQTMTDARDNLYRFFYDTTGRLVRDEDPAGGFKTLTRSELLNGFQVQVQTASGRSSRYRVESVSTGGRIRSTTDATRQSTITLETDNRRATTMPDGMVMVVDLLPDPRFGMQSPLANTSVATPNGLQSVMTHNRFLTQMTGLEVTGLKDSVVINGRTYTTIYNGSTKTLESTTPEGRGTVATVDVKGRTVRDSVSGISGVGYAFNAQGFLTAVTQSTRTTAFAYDGQGRLARITDPLLRTAHMFHDSVGRVTRQVLADGREILYAYDANGNLTALTPPGRDAHAFEYTVVDLLHKYAPPEIPPDSNWATDYAYSLDKQLTHTFLPDGDSIVVRYDTTGCDCGSLPRPAEIKFDRGSLAFTYDSTTGNITRIVSPGNDTLRYTYDGFLPLSANWSGSVNGIVTVKYDNDFRVIQQKVNGQDSVDFAYDQDGLLRQAGDLKIKRDLNNGLFLGDTLGYTVTNVGYNNLGEIVSYEAKHGGAPLFATTYERDSLGRIATLNETIQGVTTAQRYGYDLAGRLEQVWKNDTLQATYFYDANGNRDSVVTSNGTIRGMYDAQDRMLTYGNSSYFHSKHGSLNMKISGMDTTRYTYDLMGNLTKVVLPGGNVVEYLIDAQNRRVGKKLNGSVVARWLYSGQLSPVAELDSAGNVASRFIFATHVNIPDYIMTDTATYRVVTDHLGSVRLVVDQATGAVMQRMDYDAWGNVSEDSNPGFTPFGYAGGMYEQQTELVRFGARDYDATSGRWMAKDPIHFSGGDENLLVYVGNDPANRADAFGLFLPHAHYFISFNAALAAGYSVMDANRIAIASVAVDFAAGSQGSGEDATAIHGMAGKSADYGVFQSPATARNNTERFIRNQLNVTCDDGAHLDALGYALHAAQDQWSTSHGYTQWDGGDPKLFGFPGIEHFVADLVPGPSDLANAFVSSYLVLRGRIREAVRGPRP